MRKWLKTAGLLLLCGALSMAGPLSVFGRGLVRQAQCKNIEEDVRAIRAIYNLTNSGKYSRQGAQTLCYKNGEDHVIRTDVGNGDPYLDSLMREYGYSTYSLEYYYPNPEYQGSYPSDGGPVFIFAVIDGKEYRYYFEMDSMIRRIGPDGTVSDNPETNAFLSGLYEAGCFYGNKMDRLTPGPDIDGLCIAVGGWYDMGWCLAVSGIVQESGYSRGGYYRVDADTALSADIHSEKTWRKGDNGYTWLNRHLNTDVIDGGFMQSVECFQVRTTGGHVDYISGIYATH